MIDHTGTWPLCFLAEQWSWKRAKWFLHCCAIFSGFLSGENLECIRCLYVLAKHRCQHSGQVKKHFMGVYSSASFLWKWLRLVLSELFKIACTPCVKFLLFLAGFVVPAPFLAGFVVPAPFPSCIGDKLTVELKVPIEVVLELCHYLSLREKACLFPSLGFLDVMELMFAEWEDGERFSFEDSDRFEEDSLCSFISEAESLCQNWRGWRKQSAGPNSPTVKMKGENLCFLNVWAVGYGTMLG